MSECNCTMSQKLVGDGCEICNPTQALAYAKERIDELEEANKQLRKDKAELVERATWSAAIDAAVQAIEGADRKDKAELVERATWSAAIDAAVQAIEGADHNDDDSGHGANCNAMIAVEKLKRGANPNDKQGGE